ncbi:hypothetical protein NHF40_13725 [Maricaulaceae bacterium EIL42A08]|nr:hypothetical protein [Maricaulaceae bacterium EIL42A08]
MIILDVFFVVGNSCAMPLTNGELGPILAAISIMALNVSTAYGDERLSSTISSQDRLERVLELYAEFPDGQEVVEYFACQQARAVRREIRNQLPENTIIHLPEDIFPADNNLKHEIRTLTQNLPRQESTEYRSEVARWADYQVTSDNHIDDCANLLLPYVSVQVTIVGRIERSPLSLPEEMHPNAIEAANLMRLAYLEELGPEAWDYLVCVVSLRLEDAPALEPGHSFSSPQYVNDPFGQQRVEERLDAHKDDWQAAGLDLSGHSFIWALETISEPRFLELGVEFCSQRLLEEAVTSQELLDRFRENQAILNRGR